MATKTSSRQQHRRGESGAACLNVGEAASAGFAVPEKGMPPTRVGRRADVHCFGRGGGHCVFQDPGGLQVRTEQSAVGSAHARLRRRS
eukprot:1860984-Prorocentrum_lima.AAC.1